LTSVISHPFVFIAALDPCMIVMRTE